MNLGNTKPLRLLKLGEVVRLTSLSRSSIYRCMATGEFPMRVYLSDSRVAWREDEVSSWIRNRGLYPQMFAKKGDTNA